MKRADSNLTNNIKEVWLACFPNENKRFIDYFFNSVFIPENTIVHIEDSKAVSCVSRVFSEVMINGRVLKTSTIIGAATLPRYQGRGYIKNIISTMCSHMDHSELISFATTKNPDLLENFGFRTIYRRNKYEITRDHVQRITNDGCVFDPSSSDMLSLYSTFMKRFNGYKVRTLDDFDKYKKGINDQGGKVIGYYENGDIRGYASYTIDSKVLNIEECIYLDTMSLFKILNVALQQRHIVNLYVSEYEELNPLFEGARHEIVDYKMARLNNKELYNRLYNSNVVVIDEVFMNTKKPPYCSEEF